MSILEVLAVTVPVLLTVAFITIAERKTMASMQRRVGPNAVGWYGLLQAFADALKLLLKEYVSPTQANIALFFIGPIVTLIFALLGYAVIPYGPGLVILDYNIGILYLLAMSSLATYGILLAGWSANSKYAFLGSKWPNIEKIFKFLCSKQTISGKFRNKIKQEKACFFITMIDTLNVTPYILFCIVQGSMVKIQLKMNNPQVTKALSSLVGTSEAIRLLYKPFYTYYMNKLQTIFFSVKKKMSSFRGASPGGTGPHRGPGPLRDQAPSNEGARSYKSINNPSNPKGINKRWNQWLAGLIDGDGSFYLTKKGYASLEITMDLRDEHALHIVKNVYGGSVKLVSGIKAVRYSLRHKEGFLALVRDVNGEIRNSYRLMQLNKICLKYGIPTVLPSKLTYNNGWLSGFFDSDGSISINKSTGQISIAITQKTQENLVYIEEIYGGSIYIDRTNNAYKWYISNRESILKFVEYIKIYPCRSMKKNRLHLLPRIFELRDLGAHKAKPEDKPLLYKSWNIVMNSWDKF
jgi:hypothetical protein